MPELLTPETAPEAAPAAPPAPARPLFDLASLDILNPSNEGRPMELVHPSGTQYRISTGEVATVTLKGRHSDAARATLKAIGDEIAEASAQGREVNDEDRKRHDTRYLCAVTAGWNIEHLDGAAFFVTPANTEKLWTDPRFSYLRNRALNFIAADGLFLPLPA